MSSPAVRQAVKRLKGYHLTPHACTIKLNQNESPYDLPEALKKQAVDRLSSMDWNRYPTPFPDGLCQKIAERESWRPEGILVTGGSNILIQAIMMACAVKGKVLTISPSFSLYEIEAALLENRITRVALDQEDFSLPLEKFLKALKKNRPNLVFLPNPNAPTGNLFPEDVLLEILRIAKSTGSLVVVDEAYYPFSGVTLKDQLLKNRHLILVRTFSKAFSLGGVRLGYLLADPVIAKEVRKCFLPFSVGLLSQTVAEVVLENDAYVSTLVNEVIEQREFLYQGLKGIQGLKVYPSHANFLLFQSSRSKQIFKKLLEAGILIRNVSSKDLPNALRVSVGRPEENRVFLESLNKGQNFMVDYSSIFVENGAHEIHTKAS